MSEKSGMGEKRKQDELRQDCYNLGNQIVRKGLGDSGFYPIAGMSFSIQEDRAIDLRSLCL
jgi:hypothetical protein